MSDEQTKVTGRALARAIYGAQPAHCPNVVPTDQLALIHLLEEARALCVKEIAAELGASPAVVSVLVDRAEAAGRVCRRKNVDGPMPRDGRWRKRDDGGDARMTVVVLAPRGERELSRARGRAR